MQTHRVNEIRAALRLKGQTLRSWAIAHNFHYRTVHTTVNRWACRDDRKPHGGIARQIMSALLDELKIDTKTIENLHNPINKVNITDANPKRRKTDKSDQPNQPL